MKFLQFRVKHAKGTKTMKTLKIRLDTEYPIKLCPTKLQHCWSFCLTLPRRLLRFLQELSANQLSGFITSCNIFKVKLSFAIDKTY